MITITLTDQDALDYLNRDDAEMPKPVPPYKTPAITKVTAATPQDRTMEDIAKKAKDIADDKPVITSRFPVEPFVITLLENIKQGNVAPSRCKFTYALGLTAKSRTTLRKALAMMGMVSINGVIQRDPSCH